MMIIAVLRPDRLDSVTRALEHLPNLPRMTVTDARGFGREKVEQQAKVHRADLEDYMKNTRVEVVVPDHRVVDIMDAIANDTHTCRRDDGKIFRLYVERDRRIRAGV